MPQPAAVIFVYIPCASKEEAEKIGRALVDEKLAACVNILGASRSIYIWDGKREESDEVVLLAKTRGALFEKLQARVLSLHSYKTPCIAALPVEKLNDSFESWILKQTEAD